MTPDPAGMAAADPANPQSWNRYTYVMNNPLNATDPLGLCYFGDGATIGVSGPRELGLECGTSALEAGKPDPNKRPHIDTPPVHVYADALDPVETIKADEAIFQWFVDQTKRTVKKLTFGVRAPGQTFNNCMKANAGNYSLLGVADFASGANGKIADNVFLGFTPASNSVTNVYNLAAGSLTSLLQSGPAIVRAGMGSTLTYGRRTSSIMSLNLSGTRGGPAGGFPALGDAPSNAARAGKIAAAELKVAIDAGFFLAEGVGCAIPMTH